MIKIARFFATPTLPLVSSSWMPSKRSIWSHWVSLTAGQTATTNNTAHFVEETPRLEESLTFSKLTEMAAMNLWENYTNVRNMVAFNSGAKNCKKFPSCYYQNPSVATNIAQCYNINCSVEMIAACNPHLQCGERFYNNLKLSIEKDGKDFKKEGSSGGYIVVAGCVSQSHFKFTGHDLSEQKNNTLRSSARGSPAGFIDRHQCYSGRILSMPYGNFNLFQSFISPKKSCVQHASQSFLWASEGGLVLLSSLCGFASHSSQRFSSPAIQFEQTIILHLLQNCKWEHSAQENLQQRWHIPTASRGKHSTQKAPSHWAHLLKYEVT